MARDRRTVLATILLPAATREDDHGPRSRHRSILLSRSASAAGGSLWRVSRQARRSRRRHRYRAGRETRPERLAPMRLLAALSGAAAAEPAVSMVRSPAITSGIGEGRHGQARPGTAPQPLPGERPHLPQPGIGLDRRGGSGSVHGIALARAGLLPIQRPHPSATSISIQ
jgi:hypothetical protein